MNVFLSPHNDDECLFGAFTIIRESPLVVVVFQGHERSGDPYARTMESYRALKELVGEPRFEQWEIQQGPADAQRVSTEKGVELEVAFRRLDALQRPARVWAPAIAPCGNAEHVAVGLAAKGVFGDRVTHYHTYHGGKKVVNHSRQVPYEPSDIARKLSALAYYRTQHAAAGRHFMEDLREYYA